MPTDELTCLRLIVDDLRAQEGLVRQSGCDEFVHAQLAVLSRQIKHYQGRIAEIETEERPAA